MLETSLSTGMDNVAFLPSKKQFHLVKLLYHDLAHLSTPFLSDSVAERYLAAQT
jgi:hypothetical protein